MERTAPELTWRAVSSDHLRSQVVPLLIMSLSGCNEGVLTYGKEQQGAPACAITPPTDGATVEEGPVDVCAVITDADTPADQLSVAWALGSGEELGDGSIPDTSGLSCLAVDLDIGAHAVEAAVTDPGGLHGVVAEPQGSYSVHVASAEAYGEGAHRCGYRGFVGGTCRADLGHGVRERLDGHRDRRPTIAGVTPHGGLVANSSSVQSGCCGRHDGNPHSAVVHPSVDERAPAPA